MNSTDEEKNLKRTATVVPESISDVEVVNYDDSVIEEHPPTGIVFVKKPSVMFAVEVDDPLTRSSTSTDLTIDESDEVEDSGGWSIVSKPTVDPDAASPTSNDYNAPTPRPQTYSKQPFSAGIHSPYLHVSSVLAESIYRAQHSHVESLAFIAEASSQLASTHSISFHPCRHSLVTVVHAEHEESKTAYLVVPGTRLMTSDLWKLATCEVSQSRLLHDIETNCKLNGIHIDNIIDSEAELAEITYQASSAAHGNGAIHNGFFHRALSIDISSFIEKWMNGWKIVFVGNNAITVERLHLTIFLALNVAYEF